MRSTRTGSHAVAYAGAVPRHRSLLPLLLLLLAAVLLSPLGGPAARAEFDEDEAKFPNEAYPPAFRKRVNAAVDRGAHWLLRHQRPDGSWADRHGGSYPMGPSALATLAVLKSGVPGDHPRIEKAFAHLRELPLQKTYSVAILLMALDARYGPAQDAFATETVDRYGHRSEPTPCEAGISKEDLAWMKRGVKFLVQNQQGGVWRYPRGKFDLSNTQYALLGLKAASRCGVDIPRRVWMDALAFHLQHQETEGEEVKIRVNEVRGDYRIEWTEKAHARGFSYVGRRNPTGSMTTAGIAGLLICQSELWQSRSFTAKLRQRSRDAIRDAFAWMQKHYAVHGNPQAGLRHHYYYLYGLERAGILGHARFIGPHDWYEDGAWLLLDAQATDGSWRRGGLVDTCFALLFLKRATVRTTTPAITPPAGDPGRRR